MNGSPQSTPDVMVTNDGSFLRMVRIDADTREVQFGDGTIHVFDFQNQDASWRLTKIKDRANNAATIAYTYDVQNRVVQWTITDTHQRAHSVAFTYFNEMADTIERGMNVSQITLQGVSDTTSTSGTQQGTARTYSISFTYTPTQVAYSCDQDWYAPTPGAPPIGTTRPLSLLTALNLPDQTSYRFSYYTAEDVTNCSQGLLKDVTLPTFGKIEYGWQIYQIPDADACTPTGPRNTTPGIASRKVDGQEWKYIRRLGPDADSVLNDPVHPQNCGPTPEGVGHIVANWPRRWIRTSVLSPDAAGVRTRSDSYFSVWAAMDDNKDPRLRADNADLFGFGEPSTAGWPGLATAKTLGPFPASDASAADTGTTNEAGNRSLSEQLWSGCDSTGNCSQLLRSTYRRYRFYPNAPYAGRTPLSERTRHETDSGCGGVCWQQTDRDSFDGVGHFRSTLLTSNFPGTKNVSTFTDYEGWTLANIASSLKPWLTNMYKSMTRTAGERKSKSTYCFDLAGRLTRKRLFVGTSESERDVITAYGYDSGHGNLVTESTYGADGSGDSVDTSSLCTLTLPSTPVYKNRYEWSGGILASSTYVNPTTSTDLSFKTHDYAVDLKSGTVTASRAVDGVETRYQYEPWGRLKKIISPGVASSELVVNNATISSNALITLTQDPSTTNGDEIKTSFEYDGLGRVKKTKRTLPGADCSEQVVTYDAFGRKTHESVSKQCGSAETAGTQFAYDGLGRTTRVTAADGSMTDFDYVGARRKTRTSRIWTGAVGDTPVATTEEYDGHGRLTVVKEKSGPTSSTNPIGADVTTLYEYDQDDRLIAVTMNQSAVGGLQTRLFDYDGRGFLRWESQPESGMTSYEYDARGHVLTKDQAAAKSQFDLRFTYDKAERLTEISGRNTYNHGWIDPGSRLGAEFIPMKEFEFGTANSGTDLRRGKLTRAARFNYLGHDRFGEIYKVEDVYKYNDTAGRKTDRTTTIGYAGDDGLIDDPLQVYTTSMTYDALDMPKTIKYPMCLNCGAPPFDPDRSGVTRTYQGDRLKSISGYVSDISYWPNGMRNVLLHANGVADTQTVGTMPRPSSIRFHTYDRCVRPTFVTQPASAGVPASGGTVTLSASVAGSGPFQYEWHDLTAMDAIVGTTPSITVNVTSTKEYQLVISNACGYELSQVAKVTVGDCPAPKTGFIDAVKQPDGSWVLRPDPVARQPRTYTWKRLSDNAVVGSSETLAVPVLASTTTYSLTVTDACGSATSNVTITVPFPTPTGLQAKGGTSSITVTWSAVAGATSYGLSRCSLAGCQSFSTSSTTFVDTTAVPSTTYVYRVSASGNGSVSGLSNADVGAIRTYNRAVVGQLVTTLPANDMLAAVNHVRAVLGWPALTWSNILTSTDPVPTEGENIAARQIMACRARMNEALTAIGAIVIPYTNGDLDSVSIQAVHVNEVQERSQ